MKSFLSAVFLVLIIAIQGGSEPRVSAAKLNMAGIYLGTSRVDVEKQFPRDFAAKLVTGGSSWQYYGTAQNGELSIKFDNGSVSALKGERLHNGTVLLPSDPQSLVKALGSPDSKKVVAQDYYLFYDKLKLVVACKRVEGKALTRYLLGSRDISQL